MSFRKLLLLLFIVAITGGAYYFYTFLKDGGIQYPQFKTIENVQFKSFSPPPKTSFRLSADMVLNNPNAIGLEIKELNLDIIVNGNPSTSIKQEFSSVMKANADFSLPLEFDVPVKDKSFLKNIGEFITGVWKKKAIDVQYSGTIKIKALKLAIAIPVNFRESYRIEEYLDRFEEEKLPQLK